MITSKRHLEHLLGFSRKELEDIADNIDQYYYSRKELKKDKEGKQRFRNNGEPDYRTLYPSREPLKSVQRRVNKRILSQVDLPEYVQGGVKRRDNISNARKHQGKRYHFITDIKSFFPSIDHRRVYQMFIDHGAIPPVANLLTKLTTYQGELPQGSPASTSLANLVFEPVDLEIKEFCDEHGIVYTRFVDDLKFSSQKDFRHTGAHLVRIVSRNGFRVSRRKTAYKIGPIDVTGVRVKNNSLDVTSEFKDKMERRDLSEDQKKGIEEYFKRVKES